QQVLGQLQRGAQVNAFRGAHKGPVAGPQAAFGAKGSVSHPWPSSIVGFAMRRDNELAPCAERVNANLKAWLARQEDSFPPIPGQPLQQVEHGYQVMQIVPGACLVVSPNGGRGWRY